MQAGEKLVPYQFDAGELQPHQVEVKVEYCGLCHFVDLWLLSPKQQFVQ
jgi:D-arabinose 1-dehydrogenase-like Zn-dependent alcohol dehydrogenase